MKRKGEGGITRQPTGMCLVVDMSDRGREKGKEGLLGSLPACAWS